MNVKILGLIFGTLILIGDILFLQGSNVFYILIGVAVFIGALPFVVSSSTSTGKEREIEKQFLEFSRNLVESVNTGTPIATSILNLRRKDFGVLNPHVVKLSNQISLGIPISKAFEAFAKDTRSSVIKRAISQIGAAERAGGDIARILESVSSSISEVEKLKKERKSGVSNLVVQGYIIFFVFVAIILVMEFKIVPMATGLGNLGAEVSSFSDFKGVGISSQQFSNTFLFLLLVQGLFNGLVIGKIAEGKMLAGIKHSFVLVLASFLILMGARALF